MCTHSLIIYVQYGISAYIARENPPQYFQPDTLSQPTNNLLDQPQLGFIVGFRSAKSHTGAQLQNTETMHSTACHPEPQQADPANSHSAAFPHDPRRRLEALTESRDTSRYNRTFIAYANQPKLAPHIINVNIPSPAHSPPPRHPPLSCLANTRRRLSLPRVRRRSCSSNDPLSAGWHRAVFSPPPYRQLRASFPVGAPS
ncbi:hypothetical protein BBAD15_g10759 [Beauveria bassiana D1-5]|uniref:Uncharacterized protein n=1 Tax=Beauveria bassiana D1-5 TaxID=1245745 RepID=A0A0A2VT64_BEABA|nr:hypothetical protein BBAD15_g10759 [Beauveria bassiana D1-5]